MSKRHSDCDTNAERTTSANSSTHLRETRSRQIRCVAGLVAAGLAFASSFGILVYPLIVTHSIWDLVTPRWLALLACFGFFVFFFQHAREQLRRNNLQMRRGVAVAILSFGGWCIRRGKRMLKANEAGVVRWAAGLVVSLALVLNGDTITQQLLVAGDTRPQPPLVPIVYDRPTFPGKVVELPAPMIPLAPWILPPDVSVSSKGIWPAVASSHHRLIAKRASRLKRIARRAPFNIAPADRSPPLVGYRTFPPFNPICLIPFIALMTPQELGACGLDPWPAPTERQSSEGAIH